MFAKKANLYISYNTMRKTEGNRWNASEDTGYHLWLSRNILPMYNMCTSWLKSDNMSFSQDKFKIIRNIVIKRMVAKVLFYIISKDNMKNNKTRHLVYLKNSKSCLVTRCILHKWKLSPQFFYWRCRVV